MIESAERDFTVDGPNLADQEREAGLVDEFDLFIAPVVVGTGKPCFPREGGSKLDLQDVRSVDDGMVFLK